MKKSRMHGNTIFIVGHASSLSISDDRMGSGILRDQIPIDKIDDLIREYYPDFDNIIKNKIPITVVFYGCNSATIAKDYSEKHDFITTVGADGYIVLKQRDYKIMGTVQQHSHVSSINEKNSPADRSLYYFKNGQQLSPIPDQAFWYRFFKHFSEK